MTTETSPVKQNDEKGKKVAQGAASASAPVYAFGIFGAWFYYFGHVTTFWDGVLAFFKGIFWPGILVYELMKFLKL
jgi:hypothetical protein